MKAARPLAGPGWGQGRTVASKRTKSAPRTLTPAVSRVSDSGKLLWRGATSHWDSWARRLPAQEPGRWERTEDSRGGEPWVGWEEAREDGMILNAPHSANASEERGAGVQQVQSE